MVFMPDTLISNVSKCCYMLPYLNNNRSSVLKGSCKFVTVDNNRHVPTPPRHGEGWGEGNRGGRLPAEQDPHRPLGRLLWSGEWGSLLPVRIQYQPHSRFSVCIRHWELYGLWHFLVLLISFKLCIIRISLYDLEFIMFIKTIKGKVFTYLFLQHKQLIFFEIY